MRVTVLSPRGAIFDGDAASLVAPAYDGEVGILPGHAPFMTLLGDGRLTIRDPAGLEQRFRVRGGFLQVVQDTIRVVAEHGETEADGE